ncbi:MAG TPA: caspase family protein, partial [Bradyrhizobium sp.]|nr:caspase family protein [Bradyrhizobium sp.]
KTVDARFYFLPQDFRYAGEDSIVKKGVGQNQLQEWVSRIKAQKSVLLFDACESGSLVGDRIAMRGIEEKTAIDRMTRAMGRTVLTATTDSKPAIEGYRGHGVFTYTLLAGFEAADANADGVVDVTELATYVDRRLPDLTYDAFKLRQVPQMSIVGSNFPLASKVSLLPADGASPAASAPAAAIPTKPTHVVIAPADVFEQLAGKGGKLEQLSPGTLVSLVKTEQGWVLVARDGKQVGYVAEDRLMRVQ